MITVCLLLISFYYGWRYSKTSVDPDWAMFSLAGFTGSWYGRDFADCKSPGVHLWYYLLSRIAGVKKLEDTQRGVERVKFLHHFFIGLGCIVFYWTSHVAGNGSPLSALILLVLCESGWLLAFHGNVGDVSTVLLAIAMVCPVPWIAFWIAALAVFYEPKFLFAFIALIVIQGWWMPAILASIWGGVTILLFHKRQWFKWIWEGSFTIPMRMTKERKKKRFYGWQPFFTAKGMMYILPWLLLAVLYNSQPWYFWIPACLYLVTLGLGYAIRENHLIPLAAWIAVGWGGNMILPAILLVAADWISAGFYLGDIWARFYMGLAQRNEEARVVGELLKGRPGSLWVNELHTAVYIYARKPVPFGLCEQIEIRETAHERRALMKKRWLSHPPKWVVNGISAAVHFKGDGYQHVQDFGSMSIFQRVR